MPSDQKPRILQPQQQPESEEQPPSASPESKDSAPSAKQEMGEGSYEGTREYNKRTADYLKKADVEADAKAATPKSEQEERDMQRAEDEGRSHSKGEH
jgi:hypothetical protein